MSADVVKERIAAALGAARERTLTLLDVIDDAELARQVSPLMSPLCWDLAHIAHYEELWLLRTLAGHPPTEARFDDVYDAFKHSRHERPELDLLGPDETRRFAASVRTRTLDVLDDIRIPESIPEPRADGGADASRYRDADRLLADGFVYGMVVQHEHQHIETMLATIGLMDDFAHPDESLGRPARQPHPPGAEVSVKGGPFVMGTSDHPWAYDNERPAHEIDVPGFVIDRAPVANDEYLAFIEAGGYRERRWWTDDGWAWRTEAGAEAPLFWYRDDGGRWRRRRFGRDEAVPTDEPVQHVCWYETDAFTRFAGRRLPTEIEWEKAVASGAITAGRQVWEWTASDFAGYPGFASFPYREYSEVFFGPDYKVLRGGSWATHPEASRATFRNWDYPLRRQIFTGFRGARDA